MSAVHLYISHAGTLERYKNQNIILPSYINNMAALVIRAKNILEEVKDHISKNITSANLPVLASISAVDFDNVVWQDVDAALKSVQYDLAKKLDDEGYRRDFCLEPGHRLLVENIDQLVTNYNRILGNVRKYFPDFNAVEKGHNPIFGQDAIVSCFLTKCSGSDLDVWLQEKVNRFTTRDENLEEDMPDYYARGAHSASIDDKIKHLNDWEPRLSSVSPGLRELFGYGFYTGEAYVSINRLLREKYSENSYEFTRFAPSLVLPFYTRREMVLYRGDGQAFSPETMRIQGFYSTSLTVDGGTRWVKTGGRFVKITVPVGTPLLPLILDRDDECEYTLLPGTRLQKSSEAQFQTGHYVEYNVVENPPPLSESDEATIFRNAISYFDFRTMRIRATKIPPMNGKPDIVDIHQFNINLVNRLY